MDFKKIILDTLEKEFNENLDKSLEIPPDSNLGDYALPCFELAKILKKSPILIAKEISEKINIENVKINCVGPYANFFIDNEKFVEKILSEIYLKKFNYGKEEEKNEVILIDYSGPNVAKNMGIHNLRSTIIGQSLVNLYRHLGYKVIGINHLGDWGTQFGKLIWALEKWSSPSELKEKGIVFLNEMYVKYHKYAEKNPEIDDDARTWFKKIENGDERAIMWWEIFVDVSLKDYNEIFKRLNVKFDETKGESYYIQFLEKTLNILKEKNLTSVSQGALVVDMKDENMPPCLLKKKDGSTLYGTRDIAAAIYRLEKYNPSEILYVTDIAQELHFKQVFKVLEFLDEKNKNIFKHISFGRLSFPDKTMSTRKGNIIPLKEVLDKARDKVLKIINEKNPNLSNKENVAEIVGSGAIIFGDLFQDRIHNIIFEWDKILDFQGETSPYIQYTIARINSITKKQKLKKEVKYSLICSDSEKKISKILDNFNFILNEAKKQNKPHHIAKYALSLAQEFNNYYVNNKIIQEDLDLMNSRLYLIYCVKIVLESAMKILNIECPEEM